MTSQSAHSHSHSQTQPRCPSRSCCLLCDQTLVTQGSHTLLALCSFCHLHCTGENKCRYKSRLCSDIWHEHHNRIPEHTHPHQGRPVDFYSICHCWCSAPWHLPAGKSRRYTDRPQSCQRESLSPEISHCPEEEEGHRIHVHS